MRFLNQALALALATTLLLSLSLAAQVPTPPVLTAPPAGFTEVLRLWPTAAPRAIGATDADIPKLFSYPAAGSGPHPAVIVLPGGGYSHLVIEKEGADAARFLASHGVSAYVLEYRLGPRYRFPVPMLDGARAVRYLRANAVRLGLDPHRVGLWGFSAGGHLAGYLATASANGNPASEDLIDRVSDRPDFVVISYGRLTLDPAIPRPTSFEPILGSSPTQAVRNAADDTLHVTPDTPPTFLYATTDDQTVDARNATAFYDALKRNHVPAELHVFERGPHGTGIGLNTPPEQREIAIYPELVAAWLREHGWMPPAS
jgi:acetyl esterase/lipase